MLLLMLFITKINKKTVKWDVLGCNGGMCLLVHFLNEFKLERRQLSTHAHECMCRGEWGWIWREILPIRCRSLPTGLDLLYNAVSRVNIGVVPVDSLFDGVEFGLYAVSEIRTFEHDEIASFSHWRKKNQLPCKLWRLVTVKWRMAIRKVPPKKGVALLLSN